MKNGKNQSKGAPENDEQFWAQLKEISKTKDYKELRKKVMRGPHPTIEELGDYALGFLDKNNIKKLERHILLCPQCAKETFEIMHTEKELAKEALKAADKILLFQRLKALVSPLSLMIEARYVSAIEFATRGSIPAERNKEVQNQFAEGDQILFCVDVPADGYLVVLHYDEAGKIQLVFPHDTEDKTFASGGSEKKISGRVTGPAGKQYLKAIWTSKEFMDPKQINFANEYEIEKSIAKFIEGVEKLAEADWREVVYEYQVTTEE